MYFVYALLPILLLLMAVWAWLKPLMKVHGKEEGGRYFVMFLSCSITLYITMLIDKSGKLASLVQSFSFGILDYTFVRWFIFPALLYAFAKLWDLYDRKKVRDEARAQYEKYNY